jgi:hypothetical protein
MAFISSSDLSKFESILSVVDLIKEEFEGNVRWNEVEGMFYWLFAVVFWVQMQGIEQCSVSEIFLCFVICVCPGFIWSCFPKSCLVHHHLIKEECMGLYPIKPRTMKRGGHVAM